MSGGPHSQHGRVPPVAQPGPPTWNHLQVSPFYAGRQPQHAHMSSEHPILARPPTWHTPSTEAPLFSLQQMLGSERTTSMPYTRPATVDLSLSTRTTHSPRNNTNHNGESSSPTPISLSIRDAKQINSLAERRQSFQELVNPKRPKRVDSILERLNTAGGPIPIPTIAGSVIVSAAHSSHDENSNSSQPGNVITTSPRVDEEVLSPASNEDSLDSSKSRRKRKPSKTIRMSHDDKHSDDDKMDIEENLLNLSKPEVNSSINLTVEEKSVDEERRPNVEERLHSNDENKVTSMSVDSCQQPTIVRQESEKEAILSANGNDESTATHKTRRKTLSESETIENIAAMIASTEHEANEIVDDESKPASPDASSKINLENVLSSPLSTFDQENSENKQLNSSETTPKVDNSKSVLNNKIENSQPPPETNFVEVENQLEKMFADLNDTDPSADQQDPLISHPAERERVTSTSSEVGEPTSNSKKKNVRSRPSRTSARRISEANSNESTPSKKNAKSKSIDEAFNSFNKFKTQKCNNKIENKNSVPQKLKFKTNNDIVQKDYDSGSNASSVRSRGPFIQIRGPRDSPISVNIINTATSTEDDAEKAAHRIKTSKKSFHDDSEYRNKVRSKGLHSSTLSIKYDAHTTDTSWICVFCKRGPHTTVDVSTLNNRQMSGGASTSSGSVLTGYSSGDLFGPYVINSDCPEYQQSLEQLNELKLKVTLNKSGSADSNLPSSKFSNKKAKRRHLQAPSWSSTPTSSSAIGVQNDSAELQHTSIEGMTEAGPNRYEIWAHEDCIVWSPGVYLAGPRIIGLEGAVWSCCSVVCELCNKRGASVTCLVRNCRLTAHVGCAKMSSWSLDEETYKAYCQRHKTVS